MLNADKPHKTGENTQVGLPHTRSAHLLFSNKVQVLRVSRPDVPVIRARLFEY